MRGKELNTENGLLLEIQHMLLDYVHLKTEYTWQWLGADLILTPSKEAGTAILS